MPGIYDIAAGLDTRGVIGPALETGARIRLAEQTALEQPQRFAREKQAWQRQDELYAEQQRTAKATEALGYMQNALGMAQTPQTFLKTMSQLFPGQAPPLIQGVIDETRESIGDPTKFEKLKGDVLDLVGSFKRQHETRLEDLKGSYRLTEEAMRIEGGLKEADVRTQSAERIARWNNATSMKIEEITDKRVRELAAGKDGLRAVDVSRIKQDAIEQFEVLYKDPETKEWYTDAPFFDQVPVERSLWFDGVKPVFNEQKFNALIDEYLDEAIQGTQTSGTKARLDF